MKDLKIIIILMCFGFACNLQAQNVEPAPADKAVVYFVRANSTGALINFTYFDSTKVIGKFNGPKYLRYECEPGHHLLWARSENRDYINANLEAGKIYVIDVIPMMGAIKAAVKLVPVNSADYKLKRIQKLITKRPPVEYSRDELNALQISMSDAVINGMERLRIENYSAFPVLGSYSLQPEDLKFEKKKK